MQKFKNKFLLGIAFVSQFFKKKTTAYFDAKILKL